MVEQEGPLQCWSFNESDDYTQWRSDVEDCVCSVERHGDESVFFDVGDVYWQRQGRLIAISTSLQCESR